MAAFGTRNISYPVGENPVLKGKSKPQPEVKRAALKEVGNKVLAQPRVKEDPEKKVTFPSVKFPIVKQPACKRPSIIVKETKACRLRAQHSRSNDKASEKKTEHEKNESAVEHASKLKPSISAGDLLQNKRLNVLQNENEKVPASRTEINKGNPVKKETSSTSTNTLKNEASSISINNVKKETSSIATKPCVNERHNAPSAFSSTLLNCAHVIDIDKDDEKDPFMLGMYAKDMYRYIREMEVKFPVSPQYLRNSELNGKMRTTLIDWLVEVHREFDMITETLFLTVAIIDRFLEVGIAEKNPDIHRTQLQLVGLTAMFIATKYEETILPDIHELVYVSDNAYTKKEILKMEIKIVKSLNYSFGRPLPIHFLRRYSKADRVAPAVHIMAKYIMEIGIMEYDLCHIAPSLLAAAALYVSLWLLNRKENVWSQNLVQYSSYCERDVLPVVKKLGTVVLNAACSKHKAVYKKYSHPKNLQVSVLPVLKTVSDLIKN